MKAIIHNKPQLERIVFDLFNKLSFGTSINIEYDNYTEKKTLKQLGFFFGALCSAIQEFYKETGENISVNDIKENFYSGVSYIDETFLKEVTRFNGEKYLVPLRLSEMDIEQASSFIDKSLYLIDMSKVFREISLHPSIRYTWVRNIEDTDIQALKSITFPRSDRDYLEHTRKLACIWCGKAHMSEVHHLKGDNQAGTGYKSDDWYSVPLCQDCHIGQLHQKGSEQFLNDLHWITKHISLIDFCKIRYNRWLNKA